MPPAKEFHHSSKSRAHACSVVKYLICSAKERELDMQEVLRGETAAQSKEIEAPDLSGIMQMECQQDQLEALMGVFQAILKREHKLSPEDIEEIYTSLEDQTVFRPDIPILAATEREKSYSGARVRQQFDEFGRPARETTARYSKIDPQDDWEDLPRLILDATYHYRSASRDLDIVRGTLTKLEIRGPARKDEVQNVSTYWVKPLKKVSSQWRNFNTHQTCASYHNGLPVSAYVYAYDSKRVRYLANADFTDGQIAKISLSDLKGGDTELTFIRNDEGRLEAA